VNAKPSRLCDEEVLPFDVQATIIALGAGRARRVIDARLREDSDGDPVMVLVVEPAQAGTPSASADLSRGRTLGAQVTPSPVAWYG
jgi:hypothetical protein